jgi:hypothetical protein
MQALIAKADEYKAIGKTGQAVAAGDDFADDDIPFDGGR